MGDAERRAVVEAAANGLLPRPHSRGTSRSWKDEHCSTVNEVDSQTHPPPAPNPSRTDRMPKELFAWRNSLACVMCLTADVEDQKPSVPILQDRHRPAMFASEERERELASDSQP